MEPQRLARGQPVRVCGAERARVLMSPPDIRYAHVSLAVAPYLWSLSGRQYGQRGVERPDAGADRGDKRRVGEPVTARGQVMGAANVQQVLDPGVAGQGLDPPA